MASTQIRANTQIKDQTFTRSKLVLDFLEGTDLDLTNGAANATLTGLADGVNPTDAVTKQQLDALAGSISSGLLLRGDLAAPADMTGTSTGNTYIDAGNGYSNGDKFIITADGNLTVSDGTIAVNTGDAIIIKNDVATNGAIVLADVFKVDNTESPDILREADVVDSLTSTSIVDPLSANQGRILNDRLAIIEGYGIPVYNEQPTVTAGIATVTLANTPVAGTDLVYLNGLRQCKGAGNDYTIAGTTITFANNLQTGDVVVVDYHRV